MFPVRLRSYAPKRRRATGSRGAGVHLRWKYLKRSSAFGGAIRTSETYVRSDLPCGVVNCPACCEFPRLESVVLSASANHLLIPDVDVLVFFMDVLEVTTLISPDVLLLQTVINGVYNHKVQKRWRKLRRYMKDASHRVSLFSNEHHRETALASIVDKSSAAARQSILNAVIWLSQHLLWMDSPLVFVTEDAEMRAVLTKHSSLSNVRCVSVLEYVETIALPAAPPLSLEHSASQWKATATTLLAEYHDKLAAFSSTCASRGDGLSTPTPSAFGEGTDVGAVFPPHLSPESAQVQLKAGSLLRGKLIVSKFKQGQASIRVSRRALKIAVGDAPTPDDDSVDEDIVIEGILNRNRAVYEDDVAIEVLPKSQWLPAVLLDALVEILPENAEDDEEAAPRSSIATAAADKLTSLRPTGRVVCVLERGWRDYVCTIVEDVVEGNDGAFQATDNEEAVLVVPMDTRIPKIRVKTRQRVSLSGQRLVIALDDWPIDSKYPSGHYVRSLGPVMNPDTEVEALLIEMGTAMHMRQFSPSALACLPTLPPGLPWAPDVTQSDRRDLRATHLICSVDPPGCQDIDDALSARRLPNGNLEVGVHIADVSSFVPENSPLDMEARDRGTTVYLVDRRLDMLPGILCENVCSLRSRVDRYAMSVLWEMTPSFEVIPDKTWFGRTLIRSAYALTYYQAQRLVDGQDADAVPVDVLPPDDVNGGLCGAPVLRKDYPALRESLRILVNVSRHLKATREKSGALELESVELSFKLSSDSQPEQIKTPDHLEVHSTIAELMILANVAVANFIKARLPAVALLRRHVPAAHNRIKELLALAQLLGVTLDGSSNLALSKSLGAACAKLSPAAASLLRSAATRAMSEAEYICAGDPSLGSMLENSTVNVAGDSVAHYGLGVGCYTHFTSPIRRYADLVVHRQLIAALALPQCLPAPVMVAARKPIDIPSLPSSLTPSVLDPAAVLAVPVPQPPPQNELAKDESTHSKSALKKSLTGWGAPTKKSIVAAAPPESVLPTTTVETTAKPTLKKSLSGWGAPTKKSANVRATPSDAPVASSLQPVDMAPPSTLAPPAVPRKPDPGSASLCALARHLNVKNRLAKLSDWESVAMYTALYFSKRPEIVEGVVVALRPNGFIVFVQKYGIKGAVLLSGKDGVTVAPEAALSTKRSSTPPLQADEGLPVYLSRHGLIATPDPSCTYTRTNDSVITLSKSSGSICTITLLQPILVLVSCPMTAASARYPPLKFQWVANTPVTRRLCGQASQHDTGGLVPSVLAASESHLLPMDASAALREGGSLFDALETVVVASTTRQDSPVKGAQAEIVRPVKGRFLFGGFQPPKPLETRAPVAGLDFGYSDLDGTVAEGDYYEDGYDDSVPVTVSASALIGDTVGLRQLEAMARARVMKLANEKRHDRVNRSRKHQ